MEKKLVSSLTEVFLSLRDTTPNTSLRLWYDDEGMVRYHLTNNPPKLQNPNSTRAESSVRTHEIPPEENTITRRTRKRIRPAEKPPSPEISREPHSNASREEVASDIEGDRDVSITSIPCSNRFNALEDGSSGSIPLADIEGQADDDQLDTDDDKENNLEISKASNAPSSWNPYHFCFLCKTVRVSEPYHARCADCFSKHGLS